MHEIIVCIIMYAIGAVYIYVVTKPTISKLKKDKAKKRTKDSLIYISSTQTLIVKIRGVINRGALEIVADRDIKTKYEPKRLVYTGATVGGITTGGFHEEGGYNYISSANKTGKYNIYYVNEMLPIEKIQLSDELIQQAKNSEIAQFLNSSNEIILIQKHTSDLTQFAIETGKSFASDLLLRDMREGFPTLEKCEKIINWICGS